MNKGHYFKKFTIKNPQFFKWANDTSPKEIKEWQINTLKKSSNVLPSKEMQIKTTKVPLYTN